MKREYDLRKIMAGPPRMTLGVAESMTCGCVQARVGAISGASDFFIGGLTAYAIDLKVRLLGVDRAEAEASNSASARVAEEMARGVCVLLGSTVGLATTGYAEPAPAKGIAEPFAFWGVARRLENGRFATRSGRVDCAHTPRVAAQEIVAEAALAALAGWLTAQGESR
jgi:nicotinamide-nucleotide amidase